jgi:hypothetical protein
MFAICVKDNECFDLKPETITSWTVLSAGSLSKLMNTAFLILIE